MKKVNAETQDLLHRFVVRQESYVEARESSAKHGSLIGSLKTFAIATGAFGVFNMISSPETFGVVDTLGTAAVYMSVSCVFSGLQVLHTKMRVQRAFEDLKKNVISENNPRLFVPTEHMDRFRKALESTGLVLNDLSKDKPPSDEESDSPGKTAKSRRPS
jgi:hypothetical protein